MDRETIRRRHLPHWDVPGAAYFVTACLDGSIPAQGLLDIMRFREEAKRASRPEGVSEEDWRRRLWKQGFVRTEQWLDRQPANRMLESPALAAVVVDSIFHFAGVRYDLLAYAVMPSHLHWLFQPRTTWTETLTDDPRSPRELITYSLNRFTATNCNRLLNRKGTFWQGESYDHWVRDADELERIIVYVEENPVKAGLVRAAEEWPFSSTYFRKRQGIEFGTPLVNGPSGSES